MRKTKGFTVVEVLVAVAILSLFVSMAAVGTSALFGTGEKMMTVSKAAVLGSDVMKIITNEVRFCTEVSVEKEDVLNFSGTTYGDNCQMKRGDDKYDGQLVIVKSIGEEDKLFLPIGSVAYDEVRIKKLKFKVDSTEKNEKKIVSVTVAITSDGENTLWEKTASIVPLYEKST